MKATLRMTAVEAAEHLEFRHADGSVNLRAFYAFRYRHRAKLPAEKRGRILFFRRADVELVFESERGYVEAFVARDSSQEGFLKRSGRDRASNASTPKLSQTLGRERNRQ